MEYEERENSKGVLKAFIGIFAIVFVLSLLGIYWFLPFGEVEFFASGGNSNFSVSSDDKMQFYSNMRFPEKRISYKIINCPLQRNYDMENGFEFLSNLTELEFYPVLDNEEISIRCEDKQRFSSGLYIAGEGGPTNITETERFSVILRGEILLLKDSECKIPNIVIHELLHVLGFDHSTNKNNLMYNITNCNQIIGEDIISKLNEIYSVESLPDLKLEKATSTMNGRYLDTNISIRNFGLKAISGAELKIFADGELIKTIDLEFLDIGYGREIMFSNILISQLSVNELEYSIETASAELDKKNNKIKLVLE